MLTYKDRPILFIDLEASALDPQSYPVEVGWSPGLDGAAWQSVLIRPTDDWSLNGSWAQDSAAVHGISRKLLADEGLDARDVAQMVDRAIAGRILVSDAPDIDLRWLIRLYEAAGVTWPGRRIVDVAALQNALITSLALNPAAALETISRASRDLPTPHRAGPDAHRHLLIVQAMIARGER